MGEADQIKELYASRNDHADRLKALEIMQIVAGEDRIAIRKDIKNLNVDLTEGLKEVKIFIQKYHDDVLKINGKPQENADKINHCLTEINQVQKECIKRHAEQTGFLSGIRMSTVVFWAIILALFSLICFIIANRGKIFTETADMGAESNIERSAEGTASEIKTP